jgi:plasmid maintenance system antidote protein VapI
VRVALKAKIAESRKSQRQVAAEANITENRFSEIVRGWTNPTFDEETRIMRALNCSSQVFDRNAVIEIRSVR